MTRDRNEALESIDGAARELEARLREEASEALTPAPPALRSRVMGRIWETTPQRPPVLARFGRPMLAAAAVLAVTAGSMVALSTLAARPPQPATPGQRPSSGAAPAIFSLLDEARSLPDRLPGRLAAIPAGASVSAEAERMFVDARRAALRFGERLAPVRSAFLGDPESHSADGEPAPPGVEPPPDHRPG